MDYGWNNEMREISGMGHTYEVACRIMVSAGMRWIARHPEAKLRFSEYTNITGIILEESDDAKALVAQMIDAAEAYGDATLGGRGGVTGAMMQACVHHVLEAHRLGWPAYRDKMIELKREEESDGADARD